MKRITTMHLDVVTKVPKHCSEECLFISHLHEGKLRTVKKTRVRARYSKKYTQLSIMINPNKSTELPEEIVQSIKSFHDKVKDLDLHQNRNKTVSLIKYTIFELNKTVQNWNHEHINEEMVRLNLTIAFVYGDHLILFNFGKNNVYIYREGDLATFKGSRLDTDKHFSLKTGREGKIEYLLFEKQIPPIGEVDFATNQVMALFKITHRLLKGDLLCIIAENSILPNKFRVNVNLYEHAIEKAQMLRLLKLSVNENHPGYAWLIMAFDEVREFRQTVRYTLFRTVKGLLSFILLLTTLLAPSFYKQQLIIDTTPVDAFDTPPTTAHITLLLNEESETFDLIPGISGSPNTETTPEQNEQQEQEKTISYSKIFSKILASEKYEYLVTYYPYSIQQKDERAILNTDLLIDAISNTYYGSRAQSQLIRTLNPSMSYQTIVYEDVNLPVFSVPYDSNLSLSDISIKYYGSDTSVDYLKAVNGLDTNKIPFKKAILVPPLNIYPLQENK